MTRYSASSVAIAVALSLGCAGLFVQPEVHELTVTSDNCGNWNARIRATGNGQDLVLRVDQQAYSEWVLEGSQEVVAKGTAPPGASVSFEASIPAGPAKWETHTLGAPTWTVKLDPDRDHHPSNRLPDPLRIALVSECTVPADVTWTVRLDGDTLEPSAEQAADGTAAVALPALRPGPHELVVRANSGTSTLAVREVALSIEPPCLDRDKDGFASCDGDCNDQDPRVNPKAEEKLGDGIDNDCDGINGQDADRDGHEDKRVGGTDCNDADPAIHPLAVDGKDADGDGFLARDGIDDDCDGRPDDDVKGPGDCDDTRAEIHPGALESPTPNGLDDNCDGRIDEGTVAYDDDGDGLSENAGDCDDADPKRHPGASERDNCRDDDCDGQVDEGVVPTARVDAYEPNDTQEQAADLRTGGQRSFRRKLEMVTHASGDHEWFVFYSQDGDWDDWGIDVAVKGLAENAQYRLEVISPSGSVRDSETVSAPGQALAVRGRAFFDDSGKYFLHIQPVAVPRADCPLEVEVWSR